MSKKVEFGSKAAADSAREEFEEYVCPIDDDKRMTTVAFVSDTPDGVLERIRAQSDESQATDQRSSSTADLTAGERVKISEAGGFDNNTTTFSWQSAKGVFAREGLVDQFRDAIGALADYDDPAEGAEEWVTRYQTEGGRGGARNVGNEEDKQAERVARAARKAQDEQCDHARDHCEHGDPEACEFLQTACGYEKEEVDAILGDTRHHEEGEDSTEQTDLVTLEYQGEEIEVTPQAAGAMRRAWTGYKSGLSNLTDALEEVREEVINARQAFHTINSIRSENGQDELHPDDLHDLLDSLGDMPESIPEVRTLAHYGAFSGDGEDSSEASASDPPGVWELQQDDVEGARWRHEQKEMDGGTEVLSVTPSEQPGIWDVIAGNLSKLERTRLHTAQSRGDAVAFAVDYMTKNPDGLPYGILPTEEPERSLEQSGTTSASASIGEASTSEQFANEMQGTLGGGTTVEEDKQFTLTGEDASESVGAVPSAWRREGTNWYGGPYRVQLDSPDGSVWEVRLFGPDNQRTLASSIRDASRADEIAEEFTDRVAPDEISFHSSDSTVSEAAAAAKAAVGTAEGGLSAYENAQTTD